MVITIQVVPSKARLGYLDQELQSDRAQVEAESYIPDASWLHEALERFQTHQRKTDRLGVLEL